MNVWKMILNVTLFSNLLLKKEIQIQGSMKRANIIQEAKDLSNIRHILCMF